MIHGLDTGFLIAAEVREHAEHVAPLVSTTEAPATGISGLDSMALGLAVYASQ
jgi:hypothetical protein